MRAHAITLILCACNASSESPGGDAGRAPDASSFDARHLPDARPAPDAGSLPRSSCSAPIGPVDVSHPTTVVATCDAATLKAAVAAGGVITFSCGPSTIHLTEPLVPPKGKDTVIDGGGKITLDGGDQTRLLRFNGGGYRTTATKITLQHLALQHGKATGTPLPDEPSPCSQGFDTDAGGGAVFVLDGVLHVVDCTFTANAGATPGPDVAGGGVYVNGSLGAVIVGSRFEGNTASNGGAVGALNSDLSIYDSVLANNTATGTGGNNTRADCTSKSTEIGDGGSGGAVYMDGGSESDTTFCGVAMTGNHANALGGAIFRVYDIGRHTMRLEECTLADNVSDGPTGRDGVGSSAGALYAHNTNLTVRASTISGNQAPLCGAVQVDATALDFENVTLAGNVASHGIGGGICAFSEGGTLSSCTLSGNQANGGSSFSDFYGAAIFGGNLTLTNTIIADNTTMNSMGRMQCAATETGSHDLQWPRNKVVGGNPDSECVSGIAFGDPMLGPLADHGGPTKTLLPGGDAAIVQTGSGCPATDQTGRARATPCTLGALER